MKRLFSLILTAIVAVTMFTVPVSAASSDKKQLEGAALELADYGWFSLVTLTGIEGSTTYYTLDGSKPSKTNGHKYEAPFSVSGDTKIRFRSYKDGYKASKVYYYDYKCKATDIVSPTEVSFKTYINALTLNPKKVNYGYVDKEVAAILEKITNSKMTTYEKMTACYDWCRDNITAINGVTYTVDKDMYNYRTSGAYYAVLNARYALKNRKGACDNFSALYYTMLRRIGIDEAVWYEGYCATSGGGMTGHMWTGVCMADNHCVMYFDPMLEYGKNTHQYFARTHESSLKLYNATSYFDNGSFSDFWRGEDAKAARKEEVKKQKEEDEKKEEKNRQNTERRLQEYYSNFSLEENWRHYITHYVYFHGEFYDYGCRVSDEWIPFFSEEVCPHNDELERYGIGVDNMEFISLTDSAEIKYIDGMPYVRNVKSGTARIGYRPKGADVPYAWRGYRVSDGLYDGDDYWAYWDKVVEETDKYYTAPYTNWDMYPDEQWIEHSDMIYEYMYKGFDLSYFFLTNDLRNLTVETSDPDVMSVWKCKNGKLVNVDTGEKKSKFDTTEGYYAIFPTDVKETGKTKVDITLSMKGSKQKKVIHITLFDDSPAMDDGPQFEWGTIVMA